MSDVEALWLKTTGTVIAAIVSYLCFYVFIAWGDNCFYTVPFLLFLIINWFILTEALFSGEHPSDQIEWTLLFFFFAEEV